MDDMTTVPEVGASRILQLIQAYNRGELSLEEWLAESRAWAEAMLQKHGKATEPSHDRTVTP